MFVTVGIDPSLTSTGIATIATSPHAEPTITVGTITSRGKAAATVNTRHRRLVELAHDIIAIATVADLVVIEAPAYNSRQGSQHDRSGLWWGIVGELIHAGIPVVEVAPTKRAKYATGVGNASKDKVLAAVVRRYPDVPVDGNDQADALILAAIGARIAGHPIEDQLPVANLAAVVGLPEHFAAASVAVSA